MHPSILDTSIIDLLEADPRPSVIVALTPHPPTVVYTNPAFAAYPALLDLITAKGEDCGPLWGWITGASTLPGSEPLINGGGRAASASFSYSNVYWTRSVVHEQMVVVGANEQLPLTQSPRKVRLDFTDGQPSGVSPPRRIVPVELEMTSIGGPNSASSLSLPEIEPRSKSTPALTVINPKERPPSRAEAVQSLARTITDPAWILPDTTPGRLATLSKAAFSFHLWAAYTNLPSRATPIPRRHKRRRLGRNAPRAHAGLA